MRAFYTSDSSNAKIAGNARVDATYVSIGASCPKDCPLRGEGCYAQLGRVALQVARLDASGDARDAARDEARAIDRAYDGAKVPRGRMLRLHVSGDCRTASAARLVDQAVGRWQSRGGGIAWSYTHAWRIVPRAAWKHVSMLASMERLAEGAAALASGYAPACVVAEHPADGRAFERDGVRWIPCPQQTRGVACTDCGLCLDARGLVDRGSGITFAAHGAARKVKRVLELIR
jgi:hypothetical protein